MLIIFFFDYRKKYYKYLTKKFFYDKFYFVERKKMKEQITHIINFEEVKIDPDFPVFTTSVVCKLLNIPIWVLKQLDNEGIVSPKREKKGTTRFYSKKELKKINHCWKYMQIFIVKIPGLRIILKMEEENIKKR